MPRCGTSDFVARLGGDEFVVLCEGTGAGTDVVDDVCARLHDVVERSIDGDAGITIALSIGGALVAPGTATASDDLLLLSDQAMYEAKALGRGRTVLRWAPPPA